MTIFFTADLHLGHANIIKYVPRPFSSNDLTTSGWPGKNFLD